MKQNNFAHEPTKEALVCKQLVSHLETGDFQGVIKSLEKSFSSIPTNYLLYSLLLSFGADPETTGKRHGMSIEYRALALFPRFNKVKMIHRLARDALNFSRQVLPQSVNENTSEILKARSFNDPYRNRLIALLKADCKQNKGYNDAVYIIFRMSNLLAPVKILSDRSIKQGRCGEYANLAMLFLITDPDIILHQIRVDEITFSNPANSRDNHTFVVVGSVSPQGGNRPDFDRDEWLDGAVILDPHGSMCSNHGKPLDLALFQQTRGVSLFSFIQPANLPGPYTVINKYRQAGYDMRVDPVAGYFLPREEHMFNIAKVENDFKIGFTSPTEYEDLFGSRGIFSFIRKGLFEVRSELGGYKSEGEYLLTRKSESDQSSFVSGIVAKA